MKLGKVAIPISILELSFTDFTRVGSAGFWIMVEVELKKFSFTEDMMRFDKLLGCFALVLVIFSLGICPAWAAETETPTPAETSTPEPTPEFTPEATPQPGGRAGIFGICGDAGYYTYGMNEVNDGFLDGRDGSFHGGMGYGTGVKLGVTGNFSAKVGVDYLLASSASSRIIGGVKYDTRVDIPASMIFIGGEWAFLPRSALDLKVIGGYTLVNIFNGSEKATSGWDLGAISGSGSGFQVGAGAELFLGHQFSLEAILAYNYAKIDGATFAAAPGDADSVSSTGVVDYSGLVLKGGLTFYLIP